MAREVVNHPTPSNQIDWLDVQRLVRAGYGQLTHARFLVGTITDAAAARAWLSGIIDDVTVTSSNDAQGDGDDAPAASYPTALHVAFTAAGLRTIGVPDSVVDSLSRPFVEGMVTDHRSRILGDRGESAPSTWQWGGTAAEHDGAPPHVLVLSYARSGQPADHGFGPASGVELILDRHTVVPDNRAEPFGFVDGISNLRLVGTTGADTSDRFSVIKPGEVVLGAEDEADQPPPPPPAFARNGSYLVLRQLRQHVDRFDGYLAKVSAGDPARAEALAEAMVGRKRDGTPLVPHTSENDFSFKGVDGTSCPLGSHIRRANPRDDDRTSLESTNLHRIMRRGRPFGVRVDGTPDPGTDSGQGLMFVALNADLERQFEFVQHNWLNNQTFDRNGEVDPISGTQNGTDRTFTIPRRPVRERLCDLPEFVTVEGGAYFLLPSISTLASIAASTAS